MQWSLRSILEHRALRLVCCGVLVWVTAAVPLGCNDTPRTEPVGDVAGGGSDASHCSPCGSLGTGDGEWTCLSSGAGPLSSAISCIDGCLQILLTCPKGEMCASSNGEPTCEPAYWLDAGGPDRSDTTDTTDTSDDCWWPCADDPTATGCTHRSGAPPKGGTVYACKKGCMEAVETCGDDALCEYGDTPPFKAACTPLPPPRPATAAVDDFCYGPGEFSCTSTTACGGSVIKCDGPVWREEQVCAPNERCARLSESSTVTECVAGCG